MQTIRTPLLAMSLAVSFALYPQFAEANKLCNWFYLKNRTYADNADVKSPMKVDPLMVRLYKNVMFYAGAIQYPARQLTAPAVSFYNDFEYLSQKRLESKLGKINSFYDPEFDTKFYHTLTGKALADGTIAVVDPDSNGLFLYLHGSGTNKAGGANFSYKSNELAKLGFSAMSFDMPFHADGSQSRKIANTERFMAQLNRIIEKYRVPGKPVYLAGHSFGPELVFEYVTRYPHSLDGAVALSPAAFNDELNAWFMKVTSQATSFWGDTRPNNLGGIWGGHVTGSTIWNNLKAKGRQDPTIVNPKLKLLVLTGDWEEYSPGPMLPNGEPAKESRTYDICKALHVYFANMICTREPGVGHYIFAHKDEHGNDVVMRELLRATQKTQADMDAFPAKMASELKRLKAENDARKLGEVDKLAQRYVRETFFREWFDARMGGIQEIQRLVGAQDQMTAQFYSRQYDLIQQQRDAIIRDHVNELVAQGLIPAGSGDATLAKYYEYLETLPEYERLRYMSTDQVFSLTPEQLQSIRPKAPREAPRETGTARVVEMLDGGKMEFDLETRPTPAQVEQMLREIPMFRERKLFKESQPLSEWLKKWVEIKYAKDKSVESWTFRN